MTDKQLFILYCVFVVTFVSGAALINRTLSKPMDAQAYADKLCQELYGPQTGAVWLEGRLMCETARGEVIEMRKI